MMNFGILITNYENPIVMTRGDIFKRFMFTSSEISLKRHQMKRIQKVFKHKEILKTQYSTLLIQIDQRAVYITETKHPPGFITIFSVLAVSGD